MRHPVASLFLVCVMPALCAAAELRGTVRSPDGKPLPGVDVFSRCRRFDTTDAEGRFKLQDTQSAHCGRVIFFWGVRVRPLVKIVEDSAAELHVVLEENKGDEYRMPDCPADGARRSLGWFLRLTPPPGASVKRARYLHGSGYRVRLARWDERPEVLISGSQYTYAYPHDDWILNAEEFTLRLVRLGEHFALDARGRARDGTRWRYLGTFGEALEYAGVSEQTARSLDRLFDGVCYRPNG